MYTHSSLILASKWSNRYVCIRSDSNSLSKAWRYFTFLCAQHIYLNTLKLGDVLAFLLGEGATLPLGDVRALTSWNIAALLLLNSLALPLLHIIALLLGNVLAVLGDDITALLGVVNLLTHSLGHRAALLGIDSLALAAWNILKQIFNRMNFRCSKS